jgi:hypothetical protein
MLIDGDDIRESLPLQPDDEVLPYQAGAAGNDDFVMSVHCTVIPVP